jgi:hypothetical protein
MIEGLKREGRGRERQRERERERDSERKKEKEEAGWANNPSQVFGLGLRMELGTLLLARFYQSVI